MDGMICDASENVGQIGLRIDAGHLRRFDDGVDTSGALSAGIGATEEVILRPRTGARMPRSAALLLNFQPAVCQGSAAARSIV